MCAPSLFIDLESVTHVRVGVLMSIFVVVVKMNVLLGLLYDFAYFPCH